MPAPRWSRAFRGSATSASRKASAAACACPASSAVHAPCSISAVRGSICAPRTAHSRNGANGRRRFMLHGHHESARARPSNALSVPDGGVLFLPAAVMVQPASPPIEHGVLDVLKHVSRRPIEPSLASDLVADLGFDSLQILEAVAELEDRFDISIPLNDLPATRTVEQVVAQVTALVEARPAP